MADRIELEIYLENGQLKVASKESVSEINKIDAAAKKSEGGFGSMAKGIGAVQTAFKAFIGLAIVQFFVDMAKKMVTASDAAEKSRIKFTLLLGSEAAAVEKLKELKDFAANTPFEYKGLKETAAQLLALGVSQKYLIPTLEKIGNLAGDSQQKFDELAYSYGRAASKGSVSIRELVSIQQQGVPIVNALAETLGLSKEEVVAMAREGVLGFKQLDAAMTNLSVRTKNLTGGMAAYADDLDTLFKNLLQKITDAFAKGGDIADKPFKDLLKLAIQLENEFGIFSTTLKVIGAVIGVIAISLGAVYKQIVALALGIQFLYAKAQELRSWSDKDKAYYKSMADEAGKSFLKYQTGAMNAPEDIFNYLSKAFEEKQVKKGKGGRGLGGGGVVEEGTKKDIAALRQQFEAEFADLGLGELGKLDKEIAARQNKLQHFYNENIIDEQEYQNIWNKLEEDSAVKRVNIYSSYAAQVLGTMQNMMTSLSSIFQMQDEQARQALDRQQTLGDAYIQYSQQQALSQAGLTEEAKSKTYAKELRLLEEKQAKEINLKKKAALDENITEKRRMLINAQYEEQKQAFDALMDIKKRQLARQQFQRQKEIAISQTIIQAQLGGITAYAQAQSFGPIAGAIIGALSVAAINTLMGVTLGMINAQKPPLMERGGFVTGTPGGTQVITGERNHAEAIIDFDNPEYMGRFVDAFNRAGGGGGLTVNVQGSIIDTQGLFKIVEREGNKQAARYGAKGLYQFRGAYK